MWRNVHAAVVIAMVCVMGGRGASAQVCIGGGPTSHGNARLSATLGSTGADHAAWEGGGGLGLHVTMGEADGFFLRGGGSIVLYSNSTRFEREGLAAASDDAGGFIVDAMVGYALEPTTTADVSLCPIVGFSRLSGPGLWAECSAGMGCSGESDGRATTFWAGGSVGWLKRASPGLSWVPFAGASYATTQLRVDEMGGSRSLRVGYVAVSGGVSLVLTRVTVRPVLSVPVGLKDGQITKALEFSLGSGPRGPR